MRVTIISMTTFSHRSYRGFLDEIACRVDSLAVITGDMPNPHSASAEPKDSASGYQLHTITPRFAKTRATIIFPGLLAIVMESEPDVVFVIAEPWQFLALQAVHAARSANALICIQFAENGPRMEGLGGSIRRIVGSCVLGRCDYAIPMTSQGAEVARRLASAVDIEIIPPPSGIPPQVPLEDADRWFGEGSQQRFRIAFVGRLVAEKGLPDLIDVCDGLQRDIPIAVAIAGDGPLESLVSAWRVKKGHLAHGSLEHRAVLALLRVSDLLVVPSRSVPGLAEQFGRVAVEAMSQGTPVVAYDCGGLREVIGDGGFVVPEGDTAALESVIRASALLPEEERVALRNRARARGGQFSDAAVAERHIELWRRISDRGLY